MQLWIGGSMDFQLHCLHFVESHLSITLSGISVFLYLKMLNAYFFVTTFKLDAHAPQKKGAQQNARQTQTSARILSLSVKSV